MDNNYFYFFDSGLMQKLDVTFGPILPALGNFC